MNTTLTIDWMHGFGNSPRATIRVSEELHGYFSFDNPLWEQLPNGMCVLTEPASQLTRYLYIATDPAQRELSALAPMRGFGGARFALKMRDGSILTTNNAWSGNAGNLYRDGYGNHVFTGVDVVFGHDTPIRFSYSGFAVTTQFLRDLVEDQGYYLLDSTFKGVIFPTISASPNEVTKPSREAAA